MTIPTSYQQFIHLSRYSRWLPEEGRRETWEETVGRYFDFMEQHLEQKHNYRVEKELRQELEQAVLNMEIMPSMRALMTAGKALERENIAGYNCSFVGVDHPRVFDEILYVLMCGTGVGFSVEEQYVSKLPLIAEEFHPTETTIVVHDSKLGWAKSLKQLISLLFIGEVPQWDVSKVRPAGAPLKTFGGRASGPDPLVSLFKFAVETFKSAAGRRLKPIEVHDLVCKIAEIVVVGGVRRSALISLSDLNDPLMQKAKSGAWWEMNAQRALANNSAAYKNRPEIGVFMKEWLSLYESKSGERGMFNVQAAKNKVASIVDSQGERRRDENHHFGTNPCSEIILRSKQFCNLTEIVVRSEDTVVDLERKARLATILGTWQSTLTGFSYLSSSWLKNSEEERLLGVSMTGIMDNWLTNGKRWKDDDGMKAFLNGLRDVCVKTNEKLADDIGIERSAAITCVKPSGTVSQLVDSASGIHARHNDYYIRTVRSDVKDPLCKMMVDAGFYSEDDAMKPGHTKVFYFPMKSPEGSVFRNDMSAIEQLTLWKMYADEWCEHKPSVTISVKEHEWMEVGNFVWENFDNMSGVSFLPHSDHSYVQAPYQDITKEEYEEWLTKMPESVDWSKLSDYENEDRTAGAQTLACSGGVCEVVDLTSNE